MTILVCLRPSIEHGIHADFLNQALGPLADQAQFDRVMSFLESGKSSGAEVLTGGVRKGEKGCFIEPTIYLNPDNKATIFTDEIFGPVLTIKTFKTEEEAIQIANDTLYGLAASIYTTDVTRVRISSAFVAGNETDTTSIRQTEWQLFWKRVPSLSILRIGRRLTPRLEG